MKKSSLYEDEMRLRIGNKTVGDGYPCFVIAEAGVNHNGGIKLAMRLIDAAKDAGADAVKFQTFAAEDLVTEEAEMAAYQKRNTGNKESQRAMLARLELSASDFKRLSDYSKKKGLIFLSTPHTERAVELLDKLVPAFKVSSADITNIPLLKKIARKRKPVILSTGTANLREVREAVAAVKEEGNRDILLLHCTTNYPSAFNEVNLRAMNTMRKATGLLTGYSDHTIGTAVAPMAVREGACLIEKHYTLDKNLPGPDHKASLEPEELRAMVALVKSVPAILGNGIKKPMPSEIRNIPIVRKSVVSARDIKKGEAFDFENLAIKRPGRGLAPKEIYKIAGRIATTDISRDTLIRKEHYI